MTRHRFFRYAFWTVFTLNLLLAAGLYVAAPDPVVFKTVDGDAARTVSVSKIYAFFVHSAVLLALQGFIAAFFGAMIWTIRRNFHMMEESPETFKPFPMNFLFASYAGHGFVALRRLADTLTFQLRFVALAAILSVTLIQLAYGAALGVLSPRVDEIVPYVFLGGFVVFFVVVFATQFIALYTFKNSPSVDPFNPENADEPKTA